MTNLVDTGSDDSYNSSNDETMNQNGSAGVNLKWQASENIVVNFDAHHSTADSGGGALGTNNFGIVGQIPGPTTSLYKCFTMGPASSDDSAWAPRVPESRASANADSRPPSGFTRHRIRRATSARTPSSRCSARPMTPFSTMSTIREEVLLDATWKNSDSGSGLK